VRRNKRSCRSAQARTAWSTAIAVVVLGVFAATAGAAPLATLFADSYDAANAGSSAPVSSPFALVTGQHYLVKVRGTFSAWTHWSHRRCGKVEPAPIFASPGRPDTPAGFDAEFQFAHPAYLPSQCNRSLLPARAVVFQFNSGGGWAHPTPVGGPPVKPSHKHKYTYDVVGTGVPISFRIVDWETRDNNGRLKITISAAP